MVQGQSFEHSRVKSKPSSINATPHNVTTNHITDIYTDSFGTNQLMTVPTIHVSEVVNSDGTSNDQSDSGLDSPSHEINNNVVEGNNQECRDPQISAFLVHYRDGFPGRDGPGLAERYSRLDYCVQWIKTELGHLKEQRAKIQDTFQQIEHDIRKYRCMAQSVNMSASNMSLISHGSLEEHNKYDDCELMDECEYQFRGRTSSLLLRHKPSILSPTCKRKPSNLLAVVKADLARPRSLTHLDKITDG